MPPKPTGPVHAGHQLAALMDDLAAAGQAVSDYHVAAVNDHAGKLELTRTTNDQRRSERLAAIEARNKHATSHPEQP